MPPAVSKNPYPHQGKMTAGCLFLWCYLLCQPVTQHVPDNRARGSRDKLGMGEGEGCGGGTQLGPCQPWGCGGAGTSPRLQCSVSETQLSSPSMLLSALPLPRHSQLSREGPHGAAKQFASYQVSLLSLTDLLSRGFRTPPHCTATQAVPGCAARLYHCTRVAEPWGGGCDALCSPSGHSYSPQRSPFTYKIHFSRRYCI